MSTDTISSLGSVSTINADGSITHMYTGVKRAPEPTATGGTLFKDIPYILAYMKEQKILPFLVLHHDVGPINASNLGVLTYNVDDVMPVVWKGPGTADWSWSVRAPINRVSLRMGNIDYILVGHATAWDQQTTTNNSVPSARNIKPARWLYAHHSICYECPAKEILKLSTDLQKLYCADVTKGPDDVANLYYPLGFFGNTNNGKCVAVLKAFLKEIPWPGLKHDVWENCCGGPTYFLNQGSRRNTSFINTLSVNRELQLIKSYEICVTADEASDNYEGPTSELKLTITDRPESENASYPPGSTTPPPLGSPGPQGPPGPLAGQDNNTNIIIGSVIGVVVLIIIVVVIVLVVLGRRRAALKLTKK